MRYLDRAEYRCEQAFTLSEAMMKVACYDYDCVLLDLMLPRAVDSLHWPIAPHLSNEPPDYAARRGRAPAG